MLELATVYFPRIYKLLENLDQHLAMQAIVGGAVPGRVWVDEPASPGAALLQTGSRYYLAGRPDNHAFNLDLASLFTVELYPQALAAGQQAFTLHYPAGPEYVAQVEVILAGKDPIAGQREYYECRQPVVDWRTLLPAGYALRAVDAALLAETGLVGLEHLQDEMCSERPTVAEFLRNSFGVCLVHEDVIAGWSLSEYNMPGRCEVGIETAPAYRCSGLGTLTAAALLERAAAQGVTRVGWHCHADNAASGATARRAGFARVCDYRAHFAWYDESDNLAVNGNVCLRRGDAASARAWLERAIALPAAKGWVYWAAACAAAVSGEHDRALDYLHGAIARGFHSPGAFASEHLESIRSGQGWRNVIEALEQSRGER